MLANTYEGAGTTSVLRVPKFTSFSPRLSEAGSSIIPASQRWAHRHSTCKRLAQNTQRGRCETRIRTQSSSLQGPSFTSNDGPLSADSVGTMWSISVHVWYRVLLSLLISNTWSKWRKRRGDKGYSSMVFSTKCKETDLVKGQLNHQLITMRPFCFKPVSPWEVGTLRWNTVAQNPSSSQSWNQTPALTTTSSDSAWWWAMDSTHSSSSFYLGKMGIITPTSQG